MVIGVIVVLALIVLFLGNKVREYSLYEEQRDFVLYCTSSEELASNYDLLISINNNNPLPITDEEKNSFFTILRAYQFYIFRLFTKKHLTKDKKMLSLPREEFFVSTFKSFLDEHSSDSTFCGEKLMSYQNRIDDSTSEYRLTDFGYVFYKTLYATYAYEERKGVIPKGSSDYIKEALSSKTVQIMRYRP